MNVSKLMMYRSEPENVNVCVCVHNRKQMLGIVDTPATGVRSYLIVNCFDPWG